MGKSGPMVSKTTTSPRPGMDGDDETNHGRGGENDLGDLVATIIEPDWSIYEGGRWLDGSWDYPTRGDGGTQTERADEVPTSEIEDTNEIQATKAGGVIQIEIVNGNSGGRWSEVSLNDHMLRDVKSCPAPPTIQEAYDSSDSEESHSPGESWYFPCAVCGITRLEQHHAYCGLCGDSIGMECCGQWCCDSWYGAAEMCLVCFRRLLPLPAALQEKVAVYLSKAYVRHLSKSPGWSISLRTRSPRRNWLYYSALSSVCASYQENDDSANDSDDDEDHGYIINDGGERPRQHPRWWSSGQWHIREPGGNPRWWGQWQGQGQWQRREQGRGQSKTCGGWQWTRGRGRGQRKTGGGW